MCVMMMMMMMIEQKKKSTKTNAVRSTATHLIDKENGEALGNIVT